MDDKGQAAGSACFNGESGKGVRSAHAWKWSIPTQTEHSVGKRRDHQQARTSSEGTSSSILPPNLGESWLPF